MSIKTIFLLSSDEIKDTYLTPDAITFRHQELSDIVDTIQLDGLMETEFPKAVQSLSTIEYLELFREFFMKHCDRLVDGKVLRTKSIALWRCLEECRARGAGYIGYVTGDVLPGIDFLDNLDPKDISKMGFCIRRDSQKSISILMDMYHDHLNISNPGRKVDLREASIVLMDEIIDADVEKGNIPKDTSEALKEVVRKVMKEEDLINMMSMKIMNEEGLLTSGESSEERDKALEEFFNEDLPSKDKDTLQ